MKSNRNTRPLLLAGAGLSVITVAAGCLTSGNLRACRPDAGECYDPDIEAQVDAGTADAGTTDGGEPDGGSPDGGDGGL